MHKFITIILLGLCSVTLTLAQQINSPTLLIAGSPILLSWSGGQGPYTIDVIPAGQGGAEALDSIESAGTSATWVVSLPAGTAVTFRLRDSTGAIAFSSPVTIQPCIAASCRGSSSVSAVASTSALAFTSALPSITISSVALTSDPESSSSPISSASASISLSSTPSAPPSRIVTSTSTVLPSISSTSRSLQSSTTTTTSPEATAQSTAVSSASSSKVGAMTFSAILLGSAKILFA